MSLINQPLFLDSPFKKYLVTPPLNYYKDDKITNILPSARLNLELKILLENQWLNFTIIRLEKAPSLRIPLRQQISLLVLTRLDCTPIMKFSSALLETALHPKKCFTTCSEKRRNSNIVLKWQRNLPCPSIERETSRRKFLFFKITNHIKKKKQFL